MELVALLEGLKALKKPCDVRVVTDSEYVRGMVAFGWKRRANVDLLERIDALRKGHTVTCAGTPGTRTTSVSIARRALRRSTPPADRNHGAAPVGRNVISGGPVMTTMPPRPTRRCVAYTPDDSGLYFMPGVEEWFKGPGRPAPHGRVEIRGRSGVLFHVGTLWEDSQRHPEWPPAVRDWLRVRSNMPDALVVVWE